MENVEVIRGGESEEADPRVSEYEFRDEKYIIKLKHPFKFGQREVTELPMRKPVGKDLRKLSGSPNNNEMMTMVEHLSNETKSVIDRLDCQDTLEAIEFVGKFF